MAPAGAGACFMISSGVPDVIVLTQGAANV